MNPKFKSENYNLLGGINQKISQYDSQQNEFLDIKNFDFQTPFALTERWGSTQYMSQGFSAPIRFVNEFQNLNGSSFVFVGTSGALWYGATSGQHQGVSLSSISSTQVFNVGQYPYFFFDPIGGYFLNQGARAPVNIFNGFYWGSPGTMIIGGYINGQNNLMSSPLVDNSFISDRNKYLRFNGTSFYPVGMLHPAVSRATAQIQTSGAATTSFGVMTLGWWTMYAQYVNNRGFAGPIWPIFTLDCSTLNAGGSVVAPTPATFGGSLVYGFVDLWTPSGFGIQTVNTYTFFKSETGATITPLITGRSDISGGSLWAPNYVYYGAFTVTGETTRIPIGVTNAQGGTGGFSALINNIGTVPDPIVNERFVIGGTMANFVSPEIPIHIRYNLIAPELIESHKNRMFVVEPNNPSSVFFSESGEPEGYQLKNSFEVRTNDGDIISGMKSYSNKLCIFKRKSFHVLYGEDENTFILQEASNIYGAVNYRSIINFEDTLGFLDQKGIVLYNGAKPEIISQKVQPIFDRMNYAAGITNACMVHDKLRNQIMCAIPVDGASLNNITVVFDYLAKAWTTYDGFTPSYFAEVQGRNNTKNVFYGTPSGIVNWFGSSFFSDNGTGATSYFKTRFLKDMGESVQKQFRRLYLNLEYDASATYIIPVNFYQDYGTSKVLQTTMVLGQFQERIDFGISGKSIAFEIANIQTNSPLKIYGYTVESRLQRRV